MDREHDFANRIDLLNVRNLEIKMLTMLDNVNSISQHDVDVITDSFCNIMKDSAQKCNMYDAPKQKG